MWKVALIDRWLVCGFGDGFEGISLRETLGLSLWLQLTELTAMCRLCHKTFF
jgi:hypothetical protein